MAQKLLPTQHAPAERADLKPLKAQVSIFMEYPLLIKGLDAVAVSVLVMNSHRQIVFANKAFLNMIGAADIKSIHGMRVGEALGCIHATESEGGCGTTEFCRGCGAVNAILSSLNGEESVQECRISANGELKTLDLRVMTSPLTQNDQKFTVFSILDIADEKRKEVLERVFLHDLMNTAGGLLGFSKLLVGASGEKQDLYSKMIYELSEQLVDEINEQRQLIQAESNHLVVQPTQINSRGVLERVKYLYMNHDVARDKTILIDTDTADISFYSDYTLLSRIIGNMTKNALEAISGGKTVTLGCTKMKDAIRFSVHNPGEVPPKAQLQIFKRSFSTKGSGRGLGTYSIKLLSEQYLKGKVGFTSTAEEGTTFFGIYPDNLSAD